MAVYAAGLPGTRLYKAYLVNTFRAQKQHRHSRVAAVGSQVGAAACALDGIRGSRSVAILASRRMNRRARGRNGTRASSRLRYLRRETPKAEEHGEDPFAHGSGLLPLRFYLDREHIAFAANSLDVAGLPSIVTQAFA